MTTNIHPSEALQNLLDVLDDSIEGVYLGHPWIPGSRFRDGRIQAAMELARQALLP